MPAAKILISDATYAASEIITAITTLKDLFFVNVYLIVFNLFVNLKKFFKQKESISR